MDDKLKIVFICGPSRAGSTLLDRMLGEIPGFVSAGEVRYIWQRGFREGRTCGCGQLFEACEFWQRTATEAFGNHAAAQATRAYNLSRSLDRPRYLPQIALRLKTRAFRERLLEYQHLLDKLYRAVRTVSAAQFLVDSSKEPGTACLLSTMPQVDLHLIHLIRDSRAVAFSWQRIKKRHPEASQAGDQGEMPVQTPARSAAEWIYRNVGCELLRGAGRGFRGVTAIANRPGYTRVRYEDLIANPLAALTTILESLGVHAPPLDFMIDERTVHLRKSHILSGNPMRFTVGDVTLSRDEEWRDKMPLQHERVVRLMTLPWLWKYGYLRRRSG
jgi:hypothetical protein